MGGDKTKTKATAAGQEGTPIFSLPPELLGYVVEILEESYEYSALLNLRLTCKTLGFYATPSAFPNCELDMLESGEKVLKDLLSPSPVAAEGYATGPLTLYAKTLCFNVQIHSSGDLRFFERMLAKSMRSRRSAPTPLPRAVAGGSGDLAGHGDRGEGGRDDGGGYVTGRAVLVEESLKKYFGFHVRGAHPAIMPLFRAIGSRFQNLTWLYWASGTILVDTNFLVLLSHLPALKALTLDGAVVDPRFAAFFEPEAAGENGRDMGFRPTKGGGIRLLPKLENLFLFGARLALGTDKERDPLSMGATDADWEAQFTVSWFKFWGRFLSSFRKSLVKLEWRMVRLLTRPLSVATQWDAPMRFPRLRSLSVGAIPPGFLAALEGPLLRHLHTQIEPFGPRSRLGSRYDDATKQAADLQGKFPALEIVTMNIRRYCVARTIPATIRPFLDKVSNVSVLIIEGVSPGDPVTGILPALLDPVNPFLGLKSLTFMWGKGPLTLEPLRQVSEATLALIGKLVGLERLCLRVDCAGWRYLWPIDHRMAQASLVGLKKLTHLAIMGDGACGMEEEEEEYAEREDDQDMQSPLDEAKGYAAALPALEWMYIAEQHFHIHRLDGGKAAVIPGRKEVATDVDHDEFNILEKVFFMPKVDSP